MTGPFMILGFGCSTIRKRSLLLRLLVEVEDVDLLLGLRVGRWSVGRGLDVVRGHAGGLRLGCTAGAGRLLRICAKGGRRGIAGGWWGLRLAAEQTADGVERAAYFFTCRSADLRGHAADRFGSG